MVENTHGTTEFNSNMLRLLSLNKFLDECVEYSRMCYFNGYSVEYLKLWKNTLMAVYREISPKMSEKEREIIKRYFSKGKSIGAIFEIKNSPSGKKKALIPESFKKHWQLLSFIDDKLRIIADSRGMLMTNKSGEMDFMGEM